MNYSKCIIYKITCKNPDIKAIYVGHTFNLYNRTIKHKSECNNQRDNSNLPDCNIIGSKTLNARCFTIFHQRNESENCSDCQGTKVVTNGHVHRFDKYK